MVNLLRGKLSKNITSYDLLKAFAVILMVIDHIGVYFFPEQLWFRAVGRICVPVWMFLIGYSKSQDIPFKLVAGALILLVVNLIVGMPLLAMNILVTIITLRFVIEFCAKLSLKNMIYLYGVSCFLFILVIPSYLIFEYGTLAFIMAMFGWFVRHKKEIGGNFVTGFMFFSSFSFIVYQQIYFAFNIEQFVLITIGVLVVNFVLYYFSSCEFVRLTNKMPKSVVYMVHILGRRTLEIYVAHLILFKFMALYLGYDDFGLFEFKFIDLSMFDM